MSDANDGEQENGKTAIGSDNAVALSSLIPDPRNARRHSDRNRTLVEQSLREVGAARSIVVDEDGTILAGNATVAAAAQVGIQRVRIIETDGRELVAVRRSGLTDEQKRRLALFDNRAAELAEWDTAALASLAGDTDISSLWKDDELTAILADTTIPDFDPVDIDEQGRLDTKASATCPACGHVFSS